MAGICDLLKRSGGQTYGEYDDVSLDEGYVAGSSRFSSSGSSSSENAAVLNALDGGVNEPRAPN